MPFSHHSPDHCSHPYNYILAGLKAALKIACILCIITGGAQTGTAQDIAAAPVSTVSAESLSDKLNNITIVELYSSQACVFCPKAERIFNDMVTERHIIGLSCHVDYFDVKEGSLSKPFCTDRQSNYMQKLGAGPAYTPLMIINGRTDIVGYKIEKIGAAMREAEKTTIIPLAIERTDNPEQFQINWPKNKAEKQIIENTNLHLFMALYDKPHDTKIATGRNKGQNIKYSNIVSNIEDFGQFNPALHKIITINAKPQHEGAVLMLYHPDTAHIIAAGAIRFTSSTR